MLTFQQDVWQECFLVLQVTCINNICYGANSFLFVLIKKSEIASPSFQKMRMENFALLLLQVCSIELKREFRLVLVQADSPPKFYRIGTTITFDFEDSVLLVYQGP